MKILTKEQYNKVKSKNRESWLKYCFDLCNVCQWKKEQIKNYAKLYGYRNEERLIINAKLYSQEYLNMTSEELREIKMKYHISEKTKKYFIFIENLINSQNEEEIEKLFMEEKYDMKDLLYKIPQYLTINRKDLSKEEQNKLEKEILRKIKIIIEKANKIQDAKKNIALKEKQRVRDIETLEMFKDVINGKITENDLLKKMEKQRFNRCLELLKEIDIELYNKYEEKVAIDIKTEQNKNNKIEEIIYEIIDYLKNGIEDKDGLREFDRIDLYLLYSNYIKDIPKHINKCNLTIDEIKLIKTFLRQEAIFEQRIAEKEKKMYIEGIDIINCDRDERGYPIPNTGEIIPSEEKKSWFEYLENNNIPVTRKNYNIMMKRYKNKKEKKLFVKKLTK